MMADDTGSHHDDTVERAGGDARPAGAPHRAAATGDPAAEPAVDVAQATGSDTSAAATTAPAPPQGQRPNVLHRRLLRRRGAGATPVPSPPPPETADPTLRLRRILQQAILKAAHQECQLPASVRDTSVAVISLAEVIEHLAPGTLLAVVEGPDDRLGLIALDAAMLGACVGMLTTGRVAPDDPAPRKPTFTDAALVSPMLDQFLHLLETGLIDSPLADVMGGFRFASFLAEPRPLSLMLEDQAYRVVKTSLDLADGVRSGEWLCAFPDRAPRIPHADPIRADAQTMPAKSEPLGPRLRQQVMLCATQLDAVLLRRSLPLQEVLAFQPGTMLTLPMSALEDISLQTLDRQVVARGRLGQCKGARAIRITAMPQTPGDEHGKSGTAPDAGPDMGGEPTP